MLDSPGTFFDLKSDGSSSPSSPEFPSRKSKWVENKFQYLKDAHCLWYWLKRGACLAPLEALLKLSTSGLVASQKLDVWLWHSNSEPVRNSAFLKRLWWKIGPLDFGCIFTVMLACIQQDTQSPSCPIIHVYSCVCFLYSLLWSDFGASWRSLDKGMLGCWVVLKFCPFKQDSCRCSQPAWTNLSSVFPKCYSRIPARSHVLHLCFIAKARHTTPSGMCKTLHAVVCKLILQFLVVKNWKNAISW